MSGGKNLGGNKKGGTLRKHSAQLRFRSKEFRQLRALHSQEGRVEHRHNLLAATRQTSHLAGFFHSPFALEIPLPS